LPGPEHKGVFARINQQNQIIPALNIPPYMPVRLPAYPPGAVPFYRVPKFPPKGKGNPVMGQAVCQPKQLGPRTGNNPSPVKNRPNFAPSL
jgi:hypothetical protein